MSIVPPPPVPGDPSVLRLLAHRRAHPGPHADGHRIALVVGGGGMRGAYTAGMLRGLEREGLRTAFDVVYGASSGAFGGAAFVTGAAEAGAAAYPEDLATREFVDLRRLAGRHPVLDLGFLIDEVLRRRKPLDWAALDGGPLRVVATDAADVTPHLLHPAGPREWRRAVRASASIPLLAGPPVEIDGRRWVDGSVSEPLAVARALREGATHVLALLCRGEGDLHPDPDARLSWWARGLDRLVPGLGTLAQGSRRYRRELALITEPGHPGRGAARLAAIGPAASAGVSGLCTDPDALARAVDIGDASIRAAMARTGELAG